MIWKTSEKKLLIDKIKNDCDLLQDARSVFIYISSFIKYYIWNPFRQKNSALMSHSKSELSFKIVLLFRTFQHYNFQCSTLPFSVLRQEKEVVDAFKLSPVTFINIALLFLTLGGVATFVMQHTYLVALSLTTTEELKGIWSPCNRNRQAVSPFSRRSCFLNCCLVLCGPRHPR